MPRRRKLVVMGLLEILHALTGHRFQKLDGPEMERLGAELVNVTDPAQIEGYWSEDSVGYVLEIFGKEVIVRKGTVQAETELTNRNGRLYLAYAELIATPNRQTYGYISEITLTDENALMIKVYHEAQGQKTEHILKKVDYPYNFERRDALLEEVAGTYVSDSGEEVTIKRAEIEAEKTGRSRHNCGYVMTVKGRKEAAEDFFLGKKKHKEELTFVNTGDFSEGFIVRKNAADEYELVSLIVEMGEEAYRTMEEIYKKR